MDQVAVLLAPSIPLSRRKADLTPYTHAEQDLYLARDVLDKQIIDTDGVRVVRVNDLEIARVNGSFLRRQRGHRPDWGMLRRLLARPGLAAGERRRGKPRTGADDFLGCRGAAAGQPADAVEGSRREDFRPAPGRPGGDHLRSDPSGKRQTARNAGRGTVADTLEEVEPDFQARLLETMPDEKVADVLEEMAPDEAADLLAEFSAGPQQGAPQPDGARRGGGRPQAADLSDGCRPAA